jgi:peptidyl-prolyl cis-trans isomerase C
MKYLLIGVAALGLTAPAFADGHAAVSADTVLATVNGTDITVGHVIALTARLPEQYQQLGDADLYQGILDQMIQQQVLLDGAERTKAIELGVENETRAFIATQEISRLSALPVPQDAVQAAYDEQFGGIEAEPEYNASHILVETQEEALALVAELEGGADFAALAREKSTGPSGPNGGELGWFGPGRMVPAFEEAVVDMEPGAVSAPIQTQFGWHVIKLNDARQQEIPTLEDVRAAIEATVRETQFLELMNTMTESADVSRVEIEIDPSIIRNTDLLSE